MSSWFVYILRCSDQSLYAGITTSLERRLDEHNSSPKGAKYTKMRRPVQLVWSQEAPNRSRASVMEYQIKRLSKKKKEQLVEEQLFFE